jgi:hypothetical protein
MSFLFDLEINFSGQSNKTTSKGQQTYIIIHLDKA